MTTKRELKELILSLQSEIKDLRGEVQDLKSQVQRTNEVMYSLVTKVDPMVLNEETQKPVFHEYISRINSIYDFSKSDSGE